MGEPSEFVTKKAIVEVFKIKPWIASILMQTMKINKLNRFVASLYPYNSTLELFQKALTSLKITVHFDVRWIDELQQKPFITVSNHSFGLLDGIAFVRYICTKFPNYRIAANYLLSSIDSIKQYTISVNPFDHKTKTDKKLGGTQASLNWIEKEGSVGLFPSGEVATKYKGSNEITDCEWKVASFRLIRIAKIPVVPIFIEGTNSKWFHFVGKIHPLLRTYRMVKEFFNKRNTTINIRSGRILYPEEFLKYKTDEELCEFIRDEVFKMK
jgi:putative hemolysin